MTKLSSAFDGRRSMRSRAVTEEWEFATFIGSEDEVVAGDKPLWERRGTL